MIECIFTIDYEIYGNGEGDLASLVHGPAEKLKDLFKEVGAGLVVFVETVELEKIEKHGTDRTSKAVRNQLRELYELGWELALHLHPQWCNAERKDGRWVLDYNEYSLCGLGETRIGEIVQSGVTYLRDVLGRPDFTPLSFRAGNWLMQPTSAVTKVLSRQGIRIDSSVFKGGTQRQFNVDYRRAPRDKWCWNFSDDVAVENAAGPLLEIPIHTRSVPFWQMATGKRMGLQQKSAPGARQAHRLLPRLADRFRFFRPLKFDFCRMTLKELVSAVDYVVREDEGSPKLLKPMVSIGHTKDLTDFETVATFLRFLKSRNIRISTFADVFDRCAQQLKANAKPLMAEAAGAGIM